MANTKSAKKAMRQAERRALRNQAARAAVRTYAKKATVAVSGAGQQAAEVVLAAVSALDRAAHKGIVHPNAAARRKSRLMSRLHQLSVRASEPAPAEPVVETKTKTRAPARRAATTARTTAAAGTADKKPTVARKPAVRKPAVKKTT